MAVEKDKKAPAKKAPVKPKVAETVFERLNKINVTKHTEKKRNATYLTWSWAWAETKKVCPDVSYKIWRDEHGNPYTYDEVLGYMCYTEVTIEGETLPMWLPVMDGANKSMKKTLYKYKNKYNKEMEVKAATTFDINKTVMRCLVKNLAMFGLGLYIYAGEDLPEEPEAAAEPKIKVIPKMNKKIYDAGVKAIKSGNEARISELNTYLSKIDDTNPLKEKLIEMVLDTEVVKQKVKNVDGEKEPKVVKPKQKDETPPPPPPIPNIPMDDEMPSPY